MKCSDGTPVAQQLQKGEFRVIALWNGEMHDKEMFAMSTDAVAHRTVPDFAAPEHMNPDWLKSKGFKPFDHHHTDLCISAEQHESWLIYNASDEFHNFHVHQTDFQVTEVSGNEPAAPGIVVKESPDLVRKSLALSQSPNFDQGPTKMLKWQLAGSLDTLMGVAAW